MALRVALGWIVSLCLLVAGTACTPDDDAADRASSFVGESDGGAEGAVNGQRPDGASGMTVGAGGVNLGVGRLDAGRDSPDAAFDAGERERSRPPSADDAGRSKDPHAMDSGPRASPDGAEPGASDAGQWVDATSSLREDSGATEEAPAATVRGRVIDYFRNPVPNVTVLIGDARATTGADGVFTFDEVGETYDVALSVSAPRYSAGLELSGWLFVGLTRRDPTLQVYRGLPLRSGDVSIEVRNVPSPLTDTERIQIGLGGRYGFSEISARASSASWEGPASVQATAHALYWEHDGSSAGRPVRYIAHDVQAVALAAANGSSMTFDLEPDRVTTGLIEGTVEGALASDRRNAMFLRFRDGASIQLLEQYNAPDSFSYLAPVVSEAALVVAAIGRLPGYSVAYVDGATPGSEVSLTPPQPATPFAPGDGATGIDASTTFTWNGPDQVYLLRVENDDFYETFWVVTSNKQATIPAAPLTDLTLDHGQAYWWVVSTHHRYGSVDEATGRDGFLDAYCYGELAGPSRGDGSHTESSVFTFTAEN
ncbi:MAG: carboxypeptidase-like regulatory domain-containing protein [Myxococcales bacterium]|nr:carboxypeptidase-like regulatory domain-containing protein [Myxococcales bacterium]